MRCRNRNTRRALRFAENPPSVSPGNPTIMSVVSEYRGVSSDAIYLFRCIFQPYGRRFIAFSIRLLPDCTGRCTQLQRFSCLFDRFDNIVAKIPRKRSREFYAFDACRGDRPQKLENGVFPAKPSDRPALRTVTVYVLADQMDFLNAFLP